MPDPTRTLKAQLAAARQRIAELEARETENRRTEQVQTALYRIADAASAAEDMPEFYAAIHQIVGQLMVAKNFYIALYDHNRQMVNFPYYVDEVDQDIPDPNLWEKMGLGEASGLTAYLLRTGQPRLVPRADLEELVQQGEVQPVGAYAVDWLGVPLKTDEGIIGALVVQSYTEGVTYNDQDLTLLNFVGQHVATALERARLQDETRRLLKETEERNAELAIINSVQAGLVAELDMQAIYDLVGDKIRDIFDAQVVDIGLYNREENLIHFPYIIERSLRFPDEPVPLIGFRKHVIETRQALLINDNSIEAATRYGNPPVIQGEVPKSTLFVPMIVGSEAKGVISLQNLDREHAFSDSDVRLLTTLANSMSIALENARLFAETQRLLKETEERNTELAIINSVQQGLAAKLDIQAIYDLVGDQIRDVFDAQGVVIAYYERPTNYIQFPYYLFQGERINPHGFELGHGLTSHIIQSGQPLLINEDAIERFKELGAVFAPGESEDAAKSWLGVPLITAGQVTGVITLENYEREHAYSDANVRLLTTLANSMSVALESARLFDETQRLLKETEERNSELAIINSVQQGLAAELDMLAIYDLVGDQIRDIFDSQIIMIATFDHKAGLEQFSYFIEKGEKILPEPRPFDQLRHHLIRTRQTVLVNEDSEQAIAQFGLRVVPGTEAAKSLLFVPLVVGETVRGYVSLQNVDREDAFSDSDVRLLTTLANSMSVALENVRLFEAEQVQARRQAALFRLSAALAAAGNEAEICRQLVAGFQDEDLDYAYVGVFLLDPATGERVEQASTGLSAAEAPLRLAPGQGLSERALLDGQLHYTPDVTQSPDYIPTLDSGSEVDVPLKIGQAVVGVLTVESHQPNAFDQRDFDTLTSAAAQAGVALGQARSLAETRQRAAELATINNIGQAISTQLELNALIELVGEQMRQTFQADIVYLALHNRQTNLIHFPYYFGDSSAPMPFGQGLTSRIIKTGQPLLINEEVTERAAQMDIETPGKESLSYLGVPIIAGQQAIGVISVQSMTQEGRFDDTDLNLLNTIAANVGAAMQNAQLYQETQRRAEEMAALAEVSREVSATLDVQSVLEQITAHTQQLLTTDDSAILLPQPDGRTFRAIVALGQYASEIKANTIVLGEGVIGDIARTGVAEVVNDLTSDPRAVLIENIPAEEQESEHLMCTPLRARNQVIGLMVVWRRGPDRERFTQDDLDFLTALARQAAIAMTNARLFEEAEDARAEAEQANQTKSTFLANMSHELRTPLNAIIGFTKIVKRKAKNTLPEKQIDNLGKVLVSAEHLLGLINTVLDIAKIEAGRMDVTPSTFEAAKLVEMCVVTAQPLLKSGVKLRQEIEPDLPPVHSDQDKVKQILLNLLSNAAKFTHEGEIEVSVSTLTPHPLLTVGEGESRSGGDEGRVLRIAVTDSGIGMSEEALSRVFEEFQQADTSTTREYGGTGLGLSISRKLAHLLGGDLSATSVEGEGSTFTLTLPLRYGEPALPLTPSQREGEQNLLPGGEQQTSPPVGGTEGGKPLILAIDDDPDAIYLLQENLSEAGYRVIGAASGDEGLQKARELHPLAITLDILMPHKDGWQVLHDLKTDPATQDIPVIVLTIVDKQALGYQLGAAEYLLKPLNSEALLATLERLSASKGGQLLRDLLVVDDDPKVHDMVAQLLEEKAMTIRRANDGVEALAAVTASPPDAILLDLMMPRLDGFGVLAHLQQEPAHRAIPVIVLTAKTLTAEEQTKLQQGVVQVVRKEGLAADTLLGELKRALN